MTTFLEACQIAEGVAAFFGLLVFARPIGRWGRNVIALLWHIKDDLKEVHVSLAQIIERQERQDGRILALERRRPTG